MTAIFNMESANQVDSAVETWVGKTFALKTGQDKIGGRWNVDWDRHGESNIECRGTTLFAGWREETLAAVVEAVKAPGWWKDDENITQTSENKYSASIRPPLEQETPCQVTLRPGVSVTLSSSRERKPRLPT